MGVTLAKSAPRRSPQRDKPGRYERVTGAGAGLAAAGVFTAAAAFAGWGAAAGFATAAMACRIAYATYSANTATTNNAVRKRKRPSNVPACPVTSSHIAEASPAKIIKILKRNKIPRSDIWRRLYPPGKLILYSNGTLKIPRRAAVFRAGSTPSLWLPIFLRIEAGQSLSA
jgi:hypothetical protein